MTTGIFGGTFNPIHNGHVELARTLLQSAGLDEVWFVVSPQNPWKQNQTLLDDDLRLEMVGAALEGETKMTASDYELHLPRPSYMWHTLQALAKDYPEREFVLLIGGDNWDGFDRWYCYEEILNNHRIVVYPRAGEAATDHTTESRMQSPENKALANDLQRMPFCNATDAVLQRNGCRFTTQRMPFCNATEYGTQNKGVTIVDTPLLDISSTDIRRRIKEGLPWEHLVPPAVAETIKAKRLYR